MHQEAQCLTSSPPHWLTVSLYLAQCITGSLFYCIWLNVSLAHCFTVSGSTYHWLTVSLYLAQCLTSSPPHCLTGSLAHCFTGSLAPYLPISLSRCDGSAVLTNGVYQHTNGAFDRAAYLGEGRQRSGSAGRQELLLTYY